MIARLATAFLACTALLAAEEPIVEKTGETGYRVGLVTFDQKTREIRFPAEVNMAEGLLEFLIVHRNGKVHESLLRTDASPAHLNLAFTLLRYPPSKELEMSPSGPGEIPAEVKAGARVRIDVEWDDAGKLRRVPVNEWIQHAVKGSTMPAGPWIYAGSDFQNGKFAAEATGDIAAIFITNSALLNFPGTDNRDDTVWFSFPKRVPSEGTKTTVIIAPDTP